MLARGGSIDESVKGCDGGNATGPGPAIAPGADFGDLRGLARSVATRYGSGGAVHPGLRELVPGFDAPFFQAGLAGYSDAAMRIVAREHGCPLCVTEALLDRTLLAGGRGFAKADLGEIDHNVPGGAEDHPLVGQIMGSEPTEMAAAAVKMIEQAERSDRAYRMMVAVEGRDHTSVTPCEVQSMGARTFASIDVNLACPVKKVAKKSRGGHWLAEPDGAIEILQAVREAVPSRVPVTVKMRRAFDDTREMADNFDRIADAAFGMGCAWITVHGRTVAQKYIGPSRWDLLREIVERHADADRGRFVFGSGDVWEAADIVRMIAYTGVHAVSVARGCIGNPWIFRQAREILAGGEARAPTLVEQRAVLGRHFELALAANTWMRKAELFTGRSMRKFGIKFAMFHPDPQGVKRRMIEVETLEDWRGVLRECYDALIEGASPEGAVA